MLEPLSFLLNLITRSIKIKEFFRNKIKFLLFPFDLLKSEFSWLCFERIRTVFNRHCSNSVDYSSSTRKKLVLKRVFLNKECHQTIFRQLMLFDLTASVLIVPRQLPGRVLMVFARNLKLEKNPLLAEIAKVTIKSETDRTKNRQKTNKYQQNISARRTF